MKFMFAFGLASIMLCIGTLLRAKVKVFQKMLVPSSVIAGILRCIRKLLINYLQFRLFLLRLHQRPDKIKIRQKIL